MTTTTSRTEPRRGVTVRTRILAWILAIVALSLIALVAVTGRSLFTRIEAEAATELAHEADKLRTFAVSADPASGTRFSDVRDLLNSYLSHNVAEQHETFFSIVDGHADRRTIAEPLVRLDTDAGFVADLASATDPVSGRVRTEAGPAMYAALPVQVHGDPRGGALVVVEFLGPAQSAAWTTVLIMSIAALAALALAGGAGWFVAGRALTPIRDVRETAARIDGGELGERIEVIGNDDVAQLARTFNRMLDRLQSAFDGQRRFLDDAGHELRTPITVIRGHLELMGDDPVEREQTLRIVDDELRRMSRLVDDLILLARSERPDFLVLGRVDLTDLVVETLAKATAIAPREWALDAVPEGTIAADGQRLTQALLQLAANAVAQTGPGDAVAIGGELHDAVMRLWVRDSGKGIAPEEQERIFDRFSRGSGPHRVPGTGLGLAIVARIAEAHGGRVGVESVLGEGAQFTLELPAKAAEQEAH